MDYQDAGAREVAEVIQLVDGGPVRHGRSRSVGSGKSDSFVEVLQKLLRKRVLCVWSIQRDAIHAWKAVGLLHVSLRFDTIYGWHGSVN